MKTFNVNSETGTFQVGLPGVLIWDYHRRAALLLILKGAAVSLDVKKTPKVKKLYAIDDLKLPVQCSFVHYIIFHSLK